MAGGADNAYFDSRFFQTNIDDGIANQQMDTGVLVDWWFFDRLNTVVDTIYDEGADTGGRRWKGPYPMPVLQASRMEGTRQDPEVGLYTVDSIRLVLGYRQAADAGLLPDADTTNQHLNDRFVFDKRVWTPDVIQVAGLLGQGGTRSTVLINATQVKPDEMINDPDFQDYAEPVMEFNDPGPSQDYPY